MTTLHEMAQSTASVPNPRPTFEDIGKPNGPSLKQTDIDRRIAKRTKEMKVLVVGPSRTGTGSVRQALSTLGYDDEYHYGAVALENPRDAEMWCEAMRAKFEGDGELYGKKEWDALLGHCEAVTDAPCVFFWQELHAAYPEAKVILTVRDSATQWQQSTKGSFVDNFFDKIYPHLSRPPTFTESLLRFFALPPTPPSLLVLIVKHFYRRAITPAGLEWYEDHGRNVKAIVPDEQLLVYNVKEGWGPLCESLGKEVPEYAFPKVHEREAFVRGMNAHTGIILAGMRQRVVVRLNLLVAVAMVAGWVVRSRRLYDVFSSWLSSL